MWCQGYFLKIALGWRLFPIHLKKWENNYPIILRLHKTLNNMHFDCEAHLKLLKLHKDIGQAVACLYLYLGLTGGISLLFRNAKQ